MNSSEYNKIYREIYSDKIKAKRIKDKTKQSLYYRSWYAKNGRKRTKKDVTKIKEWQENNKEKLIAERMFRIYRKKMKIIKPERCSLCYRTANVVAHHFDYSEPFRIIWVCGSCHKIIHLEKSGFYDMEEMLSKRK